MRIEHARIFVLTKMDPRYCESFGLVLAEAMASGLPVVAANNTGYSTLLAKQADDCLFESGNSAQLTEKIQHLLDNQKKRAQLSNWGKQYIQQFDCICRQDASNQDLS